MSRTHALQTSSPTEPPRNKSNRRPTGQSLVFYRLQWLEGNAKTVCCRQGEEQPCSLVIDESLNRELMAHTWWFSRGRSERTMAEAPNPAFPTRPCRTDSTSRIDHPPAPVFGRIVSTLLCSAPPPPKASKRRSPPRCTRTFCRFDVASPSSRLTTRIGSLSARPYSSSPPVPDRRLGCHDDSKLALRADRAITISSKAAVMTGHHETRRGVRRCSQWSSPPFTIKHPRFRGAVPRACASQSYSNVRRHASWESFFAVAGAARAHGFTPRATPAYRIL